MELVSVTLLPLTLLGKVDILPDRVGPARQKRIDRKWSNSKQRQKDTTKLNSQHNQRTPLKSVTTINLRCLLSKKLCFSKLLTPKKGKVLVVCSVEVLYHSEVIMCSYEEIHHAVVVRKIRQPERFQKYFGLTFRTGDAA